MDDPTCGWHVLRNEQHDLCGRPAVFTFPYPDGLGHVCEQHAQWVVHEGHELTKLEDT